MGQHLPRLGKYSPDLPTFANLFWSESIHLSTFANLFWSDSKHSSTFANLLCLDSPDSPTFAKGLFWEKCDSPRHIRTSNLPFWQIWGEWPLLSFNIDFGSIEKHFLLIQALLKSINVEFSVIFPVTSNLSNTFPNLINIVLSLELFSFSFLFSTFYSFFFTHTFVSRREVQQGKWIFCLPWIQIQPLIYFLPAKHFLYDGICHWYVLVCQQKDRLDSSNFWLFTQVFTQKWKFKWTDGCDIITWITVRVAYYTSNTNIDLEWFRAGH
jgi:hypothetical protein